MLVGRRAPLFVLPLVLLAAGCSRTQNLTHPHPPGTVVSSSWFPTRGPSNTLVRDVISSGGALIAATYDGMLRTTDLGASWVWASRYGVDRFARAGDRLAAYGGQGFQMSADDGASWFESSSGLPPNAQVTAFAADSAWLFVGVSGAGVYRSSDGGATWNPFNRGLPAGITPGALLGRDREVLMGTDDGRFFHSDDLGFTWTAIGSGGPHPSEFFVLGTELFAIDPVQGVYLSPDGGVTWELNYPAAGIRRQAVDGSRMFLVGSSGLWIGDRALRTLIHPVISLPRGATFTSISTASGAVFFGTLGAGVMQAADLPTWTLAGPPADPGLIGPPTSGVSAIAELEPGHVFAGVPGYSVFRTSDVGATWASSPEGIFRLHAFATVGAHAFSISAAGVFRSDDDGASWFATSFTPATGDPEPLALAENDHAIVVVTTSPSRRVFHSSDLGTTWTEATGLPASPDVRAVTSNRSHFFLAVNDDAGSSRMYRSTDDGATWSPLGSGLPAAKVLSLAASGLAIYAGGPAGVYVSRDDGLRWAVSGLLGTTIVTLAARAERVAAISSSGQLSLSTDEGTTWAPANQGLGTSRPTSVAFAGDRWYVGTVDHGVWWHVY